MKKDRLDRVISMLSSFDLSLHSDNWFYNPPKRLK